MPIHRLAIGTERGHVRSEWLIVTPQSIFAARGPNAQSPRKRTPASARRFAPTLGAKTIRIPPERQ
jgi:hypothetical protein